jgi:acetylornithine deacetylase/succinyl-diaminopimelate desuccinylase-like protein
LYIEKHPNGHQAHVTLVNLVCEECCPVSGHAITTRKSIEPAMATKSTDLKSLEMIRRLIEIPTVSRDSNLALIEHAQTYLRDIGIDSSLFFSEDRRKASLHAVIGPKDRAGVLLVGHTDVVPVDGQSWTVDPWKLTEKDGKLFGRGVCDMKGFVAVALAFAPEFLRRSLKIPIHYGFTFDEEISRVGITKIVDALGRNGHVHRRRANRNDSGHSAQGQKEYSLPRARV